MRRFWRLSPRARKIVDWILGLALIGLGIIGAFLPILQGWVFILAGLAVLSSHSKLAHAINERIKSMGRQVRDRVVRKHDRHRRSRTDPNDDRPG